MDVANRRIQPVDLTASPSASHLAAKQLDAQALQKLLPNWTVESAVDVYHGKGFTEAKVLAQLKTFMETYGMK